MPTGIVEDAVEELEADDGEDDDREQNEQADLQQRRHCLQNRLEHDLQTCVTSHDSSHDASFH
jgi:hypothetical protein